MKYSGLVLPWDQAGGCGFVSSPHPALLQPSVHPVPWTTRSCEGNGGGGPHTSSLPPNIMLPFSAHLHRCFPPTRSRRPIPPTSFLDRSISALWLFPAGEGAGYSSMWTLSIHDQWRGPELYTKSSRRAGLFYSQPCGFKQIAQTGELKQILSYRSKTWRENR